MDLLWPGALILIGLVPLSIAAYIWVLRRRRRFTVRFSSLSLVRDAIPKRAHWRRHVPFALLLGALSSLAVAAARPVSIVSVPSDQTTIILAMDVSRSMCSTDIKPNRLLAAEAAAISFIQNQSHGRHIGIVAFAGFAEIIQPPTTDVELLQDAIESLTTGRRTAIGSSILKSIDAIAEIDKSVAPSTRDEGATKPQPVAKGAYAPAIIVLLTDGANNAGPQPIEAAQQAVERGVRVYTIGFGTATGSERPICSQLLTGGEPLGGGPPRESQLGGGFGGGGGPGGFRRGIDEDTLKKIADLTDAKYYSAESAGELSSVFESLPTNLITKHETTEISFAFAAVGALLAVMAIGLSLWWHVLP